MRNLISGGVAAASLAMAAGAAQAQSGDIVELRLRSPSASQSEGGILRCAAGEDHQMGLVGEDANMNARPLEPHDPVAFSTNEQAVRAARQSSYYVVNVRCMGDGEAWVVARAAGRQAVFPVLVGSARRQAAMTTQPPAGPALAAGAANTGQPGARAPSLDQINRAADAARNVLGVFRRR